LSIFFHTEKQKPTTSSKNKRKNDNDESNVPKRIKTSSLLSNRSYFNNNDISAPVSNLQNTLNKTTAKTFNANNKSSAISNVERTTRNGSHISSFIVNSLLNNSIQNNSRSNGSNTCSSKPQACSTNTSQKTKISLTPTEQKELEEVQQLYISLNESELDNRESHVNQESLSFFGLDKKLKEFIFKAKGISSLYDWQKECLSLNAIKSRKNLIYALPTSGGKSLVAEILMLREIKLRKQSVILILPFVSIVQEKVCDLMPLGNQFKFLVEEYCAGKGCIPPKKRHEKNSLYICTIEKAQILMDSLFETGRMNEISMVVVDELHMVGDSSRGYVLESILAKIMYHKENSVQIVGMSATIGNLNDLALFLNAEVYTRDFRPVELKEYVKFGKEIMCIDSKSKTFIQRESNFGLDVPISFSRLDPDHIHLLIEDLYSKNQSCLIFCPTKANCENVAILLYKVLSPEIKHIRTERRKKLIDDFLSDANGKMCPILKKTILYGIAYHHSGNLV
jgi:superfamily II helicase